MSNYAPLPKIILECGRIFQLSRGVQADLTGPMKIGFIGLGNVGGKLAGSLIRNGHVVTVRDLDAALVADFVQRGATAAASRATLRRSRPRQEAAARSR